MHEAQSGGDNVYGPGDLVPFDNGVNVEYDLQDGVGIRSSAQVKGYFSVGKYGEVYVYASVFHGEKFIEYTYTANVRFTVNDNEQFYLFSTKDESLLKGVLYEPLGVVRYNLPSTGTVTMEINIGYEVNTGAGYFNGELYNGTFNLGW